MPDSFTVADLRRRQAHHRLGSFESTSERRAPASGTATAKTTFPWQAYVHSRGADPEHAFRWTYHFAWGLDDIATVFARMWEQIDGPHSVGCLWNDDLQGSLLRHREYGFSPVTSARGHTLTDLGPYTEPAVDFVAQVGRMREHGVDIVTSAATAIDLALFHQQARQAGVRPRLITCSRWLTHPHTHTTTAPGVHDELADARVATLVYWSPNHPYHSGLDGTTCAELTHAYQRDTGETWLQPLGPAYALVVIAHHALTIADDPTDHAPIAHALARTTLSTITGTLDWKRAPPPPHPQHRAPRPGRRTPWPERPRQPPADPDPVVEVW
ncbi:ABC transporter substrate-binding protein [Streptomyces sp. BK79]|uniref:ABC transporter substrate-binding protein n=1 Tax=Streptomyces sp. BK79 TaxID=3350097 RepID=UPI00376FB045